MNENQSIRAKALEIAINSINPDRTFPDGKSFNPEVIRRAKLIEDYIRNGAAEEPTEKPENKSGVSEAKLLGL